MTQKPPSNVKNPATPPSQSARPASGLGPTVPGKPAVPAPPQRPAPQQPKSAAMTAASKPQDTLGRGVQSPAIPFQTREDTGPAPHFQRGPRHNQGNDVPPTLRAPTTPGPSSTAPGAMPPRPSAPAPGQSSAVVPPPGAAFAGAATAKPMQPTDPPPAVLTTPKAQAVKQEAGWRLPMGLSKRDDPLLDSLVVLTALFERPHSPDALTAGLPLVNDRLTPELFVRSAGRAGLSARIVKRRLQDIAELSLPCVLLLADGKACVMVRIKDRKNATVIMPETGHGVSDVALEQLKSRYTGYAIFARPEYQFDARSEATELSPEKSWFWGTLRSFWRVYAQVALAALFVNLFAIALPLFTMNVYDRVVPTQGVSTLWVLVVGVFTIFVFEFILRMLRGYFVDSAGRSADVIMSSLIFQQVLGIRMASRPPSAGAFANQLREFETLRDFFTSATMVAMIDLPFLVLFIAIVFIIGGPIAFVPLAAVPIVIICGLILHIPMTRVVQKSARESAQKHALLVESIVGLETIKSLGAEGRTQRNWERFVGVTSKSALKVRTLSTLATFITNFTTQLASVAVVIVGVYLIFEGHLTVGALIACTMLTGRAMAPLSQVAAIMTRFNQSMVSLRTLDKVMQTPIERPQGKNFVHRPVLSGEIEFKDVQFKYPNQEIAALDGVSFHIKPGERVGIIGKIGSGKSTIEKLILGLYAPESGSVRIDGIDLQQIDPADLRRNIGYVSQDIFLFFGSVRDNIAIGVPHVDDAAILRAARLSGVDNFISKHPLGFDLQVGERGEHLSGGQRQSIAIARAMVRDPRILVLDEPTSAMDKGSEDWFIARLKEYLENKTLVVVTQRVSLLALVDRLIVMDGAKVVADGPRDQVLETLARGQIRGANA
ncbi:MAG: type I secretion system permease/ATPase [Alphaproteobacteria bacterium]